MKRTAGLVVIASLVLAFGLVSCDGMFENNLFGGMTHPDLTADSVQEQSPSELKATLDSEVYMDQVADDPDLKEAILATLAESYDEDFGGDASTPEGQTAAILAADVMIDTVPEAAQFVAGVVGIIENVDSMGDSAETMTATLQEILPSGVIESLENGDSEPPESFVAMIDAFVAANVAYQALGNGLTGDEYAAEVSPEEALDIAINAVICGAIGLIDPVDPEASTAEALWAALVDPANAETFITIEEDAFSGLTEGGSIYNLLMAAGLDFGSGE